MKTGLFFGSFDPIHTGHLIIANTVLNQLPLAQVWFVVSPHNPFKQTNTLLPAETRFNMVQAAIAGDDRLYASRAELNLPTPSYTINTLTYLDREYPAHEFYLLMGSDSYLQLPQWKGYEDLIRRNLVVYERPGFALPADIIPSKVSVIRSPLLNISATQIRELVRAGKSIRYLVPGVAQQQIENQSLYK